MGWWPGSGRRRGALGVALGLAAGCPGPGPAAACADLCEVLVVECDFAAYPDLSSCEQGCRYDASVGGDPASLQACVTEAGCDMPLLLECSRAYGGVP